jgi:hypothetical protein
MEVLLYQVGIFLAILIAGKLGKNARITAIVLICIFTVLQVYMSWLLILQFITIIISYLISKSLSKAEKTSSSKKKEPNLETKKVNLKKELNKKIPAKDKIEIIQEIRETEEKQKNIEIKKFKENLTYIYKKYPKSIKNNLYTIDELHSLNDTLGSDPKTHAKLSTLRTKLSKSHPQFDILMNASINKETDINIIGSTIFINSEIVYTEDYLMKVINEYGSKYGYLSYNKGILIPKIIDTDSENRIKNLEEKFLFKKIKLLEELEVIVDFDYVEYKCMNLKKGTIGEVLHISKDGFEIEFYDKNGDEIKLYSEPILQINQIELL